MKILHVIDHLEIGGAQKLVYDLALIQKQQRHDVSVLSLLESNTFLEHGLQNAEIPVHHIYKTNHKCIYNPLTVFHIGQYLRKADIVHVHLFPANYWCGLYKWTFNRKLKLVTTEHSTNNKRRDKLFFEPIERFVYHQYNAIVACSEAAQHILNGYLDENRVTFISNGVNVDAFYNAVPYDKKTIYGVSEETVIISMVARFRNPKDQQTVIKSLTFLPENIHAVFIGDGETRNECEGLAQELGVNTRCHFLGTREDVASLVKTSDINILSSKWEGLSLSSVECMATGKPFIGSDVQGIREIVKDAGLLFEYGNEKKLAEKITIVIQSPDFYQKIGDSCLQRAFDYGIAKTNEAYMKIYNQVIDHL